MVGYAAMVYGPVAAFLVELFPTRIRYTSMSLPYHIGAGVFGGMLPLLATAVVNRQHLQWTVVSDCGRRHDHGDRRAAAAKYQGRRHQGGIPPGDSTGPTILCVSTTGPVDLQVPTRERTSFDTGLGTNRTSLPPAFLPSDYLSQ